MNIFKTSISAASILFVMSNFAVAGTVVPTTGHGYSTVTASTTTPFADGSILIEQTSHGVWVQAASAANFPSPIAADCHTKLLLSAQGANIATRGICKTIDIDGDGFIATNGASAPDFSDCNWTMYGGSGKYAGVTGSGTCAQGGPFTTTGNDSQFSWKGEWVLP